MTTFEANDMAFFFSACVMSRRNVASALGNGGRHIIVGELTKLASRHNKRKPRTTIGVGIMTGKFFAVAAAAALACSAPIAPAGAADFVLKFGTATINETQHQFIKFYKEELEKASGGRIEVQVYPASQLGPIPREI